MPSERKFLTGLFKWEDIKRWHTTWPVYLCEIFESPLLDSDADKPQFPYSSRS